MDFSPANGTEAWFAAEQITPGLVWDYPPSNVPLYLWEDIAQGENIADPGSCPYTTIDGNALTWVSNCRSQDGYEWSGKVTQTEWEEDDLRWTLWEFDLEIIGDVEDPSFDRLTLDGKLYVALGDGESLDRSVQVNARAGIEGFWSQQSSIDQREAAWADWVNTGRYEQVPSENGNVHLFSGNVELGSLGGFQYKTSELQEVSTCPGEPSGSLEIVSDTDNLQLQFNGAEGCDQCADLIRDGEFAGQACAG